MEIVLDSGLAGQFFLGELPNTICFVPTACLAASDVREAYIKSGWHRRNVRLNPNSVGGMLLPRLDLPVDAHTEATDEFLRRARAELGLGSIQTNKG